ncbi:hypothetical protein [Acetobacter syzygii]|uniref:Uncharacterized protein n=1 Tax=Acetobacter syzygii TaxID=146476 RepID=A0A270B7G2_9PROT|nr:hypothetical protein [Acetobacter syzygii]NSL92734.1 hypothetical protein [Acetobacter syzygii]PAL20591.1 hypothetical protein B9K05_12890 [Acetobacter syzygii]PAL21176.1 hypothetical protein B9K04_12885 [Acetobacter syzygii]
MTVLGSTDYLYLYNGNTEIDVANSSSITTAKTSSQENVGSQTLSEDVVSLSEDAQIFITSNNTSAVLPDETQSLKEKIDQQFQDVEKNGSFITFDTSKGGQLFNWSSFTDEELAQITLNKKGSFSKDISIDASGALSARVAHSLNGLDDHGDYHLGVKALFSHMGADVREALNWTAADDAAIDRSIAWDQKNYGSDASMPASILGYLDAKSQHGAASISSSKGGIESLLLYYRKEELKQSSDLSNGTEKSEDIQAQGNTEFLPVTY